MRPPQPPVLIKLYRKMRFRKGFGVHSPFVYNLITKVIEEKSVYYAFEEIENFRKQLLTDTEQSAITSRETQPAAYGAFLFRMVHFFKCQNIMEIGSSTGVMGLYLAMASRTQCNCWLLDERHGLAHEVRRFASAHHLNKLQYIEGDYMKNITRLGAELPEVDLLFFNHLPETYTIDELIRRCQPLMSKRGILILDNINRNKEMRKVWKSLKHNPQMRIMVDLYTLGIVFLNDRLPKQYYKAYFNSGKKHNLPTHRRKSLHFIRWRKKNAKNAFAHRSLRYGR